MYMSEKCKTEFFMPVGVRPVLKVVRVCMRGKLNTFFLELSVPGLCSLYSLFCMLVKGAFFFCVTFGWFPFHDPDMVFPLEKLVCLA